MIEFINRNLYKTGPEYFYRVRENVTTFKMDPDKNDAYNHQQDFKGKDLLKCKREAEKYYNERLEGFENGSYFLPFASPLDFELGKNAAFSIELSFVEYYNEDDEIEYSIIGGEEEKFLAENRTLETAVLRSKGFFI